MDVSYQDINELLARGKAKSSDEIKKADKYLKSGTKDKPEKDELKWLEGFFRSNSSNLKQTILRAISSGDGINSLSGYSEGYFNEIIQNANDLHAGECIDIDVSTDGLIYSVKCTYSDKGFSLSNIYGFLNREMSDKSSEDGQTGKFGVGIKSFFKFVSKFRIESNVILEFTIDWDTLDVIPNVDMNDDWDKENTVLYFEYSANKTEENGFNTRKLSDLIDYLDKDCDGGISKFFLCGNDNELIFDFHSLIFMNRNANQKTISKIKFSGSCHSISVECKDICKVQEIETKSKKWKIRNVCLCISADDEEYDSSEYIIFTHDKTSVGFPLNNDLDGYNRFYSTYYIKRDENQNKKILPLSMIIDTSSANIHRNDLGDNEKSIRDAYDKIKKFLSDLFWFMCSPEIAKAECLDKISDIFHSVLYRYIDKENEEFEESPFNLEGMDNQYLPKIAGNSKTDVVVHKPLENYQKYTPLDKDSVTALTETYFKFIEKDNVTDYEELVDSDDCIDGVIKIYRYLYDEDYKNEENYKTARKILHFFPGVAEYITYVISGEYRDKAMLSDQEIDQWLFQIKSISPENFNQGILIKLIGRYNLNTALSFDGTLIKERLSFKDYLFNEIPELKNGYMTKWQNEQFDSQYSGFKQQMLGNRLYDAENKQNKYKIRFIEPCSYSRSGWDRYYDYYNLSYEVDFISEENKLILLEKIASDSELRNSINDSFEYLFEKRPINWRYREKRLSDGRPFKYCYRDYEQQIIWLKFLKNIKLDDFGKFLRAVQCRKKIKDYGQKCNISISCHQAAITTHDISSSFLPQLVSVNEESGKKAYLLNEYKTSDVIVDKIEENTNNELLKENREFILRISGYRLFVSRFDSDSKKYMIAYFGNRTAAIKTAASSAFKSMATYNSKSKDVYIFYDNVPDIQSVVASVLSDMKLSKNLMELLTGYIHNGNDTKTMNYLSRRRTFARVKKKLVMDWADISSDDVEELEDNEVIYRLLTARGSYDIYCPICSDIPLETFDYGEDTKKKHSRKIVVMENENPDTKGECPYIITVSCSYCFEKLRNTLSKSEFDGKNITLTTQIAQGQHEKMRSRHQIELSPVNIHLMKSMKFRKK